MGGRLFTSPLLLSIDSSIPCPCYILEVMANFRSCGQAYGNDGVAVDCEWGEEDYCDGEGVSRG